MEPQPPATSKKWFVFRLAFVAFSTSSGPTLAMDPGDVPAWPLIIAFLGTFFFTVSHLRAEVRRKPASRHWLYPSWFTSPFSGPASGFHLGSFGLFGLGTSALILALYRHQPLGIPLFPFVVGLGIYCGLRVFYRYCYDGALKGLTGRNR